MSPSIDRDRTASRRALLTAAALLPGAAALAACTNSGGEAPGVGGGEGEDAYATVISGGPTAEAAEIEKSPWAQAIKDAGQLKRGGTTANKVFSVKDPTSGKITGFDAGITQLLAQYILGEGGAEKVEYIDTTVDTRETMLENHTIDCVIATYSITKERLAKIAYAGPYYMSGAAILVRAEDKDSISGPEDLTGKKLVTESNSTGIATIEEHVKDPASVQQLPDNESCVAGVKQKRFDAYVLDQGVLMGAAKSDESVVVVGKPFTEDPYGIGAPQDAEGATEFINGFLTKIEDDGTWKKLYEATIGQVVEGEAPTPPTPGDINVG